MRKKIVEISDFPIKELVSLSFCFEIGVNAFNDSWVVVGKTHS